MSAHRVKSMVGAEVLKTMLRPGALTPTHRLAFSFRSAYFREIAIVLSTRRSGYIQVVQVRAIHI